MRNSLLRILGALMCVLAAYADVMPVRDFNLEKMAGKWFMVGFATDADWFVNNKDSMKMGTVVITPTEGGNATFAYANLRSDGSCWRMTNQMKHTDTPGRFEFHSNAWQNDNDLRIVEVQYNDYALFYTIKTKNGVSEVLNELYGRTPECTATHQQRFREFSTETGIQADNIVILPKNPECPDA